jgi:glutamine amidotransferase
MSQGIMIAVINYDTESAEKIGNILANMNIPFKITRTEEQIVNADKIILPDAANLKLAFRKLQFMNLLSLLKMVNKPILGIGTGVLFMCEFIDEECRTGLGFFPVNIQKWDKSQISEETKLMDCKLVSSAKSKLAHFNSCDIKHHLGKKYFVPVSNLTTAVAELHEKKITEMIEKNNYFGVCFDADTPNEVIDEVLLNFNKL